MVKMNKSYVIIGIILILIIISIVAGVRIFKKNSKIEENTTETTINENQEANKEDEKEEKEVYLTGKHNVEIKIKDYGTIALELDADTAPITVTNFIKLANEGFYDGLTFHRIISGFMIQGGDPQGNGTGGSEETIKGEFSSNGVENSISHTRGVISMARSSLPNSASSQFFIVHEDSTFLDGQYAAFGHVTSGIEIVDKICENTPVTDSNGTVSKVNQPVIEKITVVD
jgi:peptidyl-prolyl cis-trans isomerase B (cyclophilin B)